MERFLSVSIDRTLIMCHPGIVDDALKRADSLVTRREEELRYFMSGAFAQRVAREGVSLADANPSSH